MELLNVKNLNVSFKNKDNTINVIRDFNIKVNVGEIVGLVGESGSGKSVSMHSILRLVDKTAVINGEIIFDGKDISNPDNKLLREIRREIGVVFQEPMTSLNPVFTIGTQLRDSMNGMDLSLKEKNEKIVELLNLVGITDGEKRLNQYPHEFSGGQRQRIMIAMALAGNPKLLIADEPTTALDVTVQAQILELIADLSKKLNMAVVIITHDLGVIAKMCNRVYVLYAGKICEEANVDDLFYATAHEYTRGLLRAVPSAKGGDRLVPIGGTAVNLLALPKGCGFSPRCPMAMKICLSEMPQIKEIGKDHYAACWLNEKVDIHE